MFRPEVNRNERDEANTDREPLNTLRIVRCGRRGIRNACVCARPTRIARPERLVRGKRLLARAGISGSVAISHHRRAVSTTVLRGANRQRLCLDARRSPRRCTCSHRQLRMSALLVRFQLRADSGVMLTPGWTELARSARVRW